MPGRKLTAEQFPCPLTRTAAVIGSRWTALIIDALLSGERRFQELQETVAGIPPATLSARLKSLEKMGILTRKVVDSHPPYTDYRLTASGRSLASVIGAMRRWGEKVES